MIGFGFGYCNLKFICYLIFVIWNFSFPTGHNCDYCPGSVNKKYPGRINYVYEP
ncbi:hypothetical protein D1AOALGA4SA_11905 [Olavius algarvensis Delta 1 endosymbiont]|nr:hypothetical protein D1AOALGA4SA_11905 [Olavius algarvensis Delta 1 endosymbiont]